MVYVYDTTSLLYTMTREQMLTLRNLLKIITGDTPQGKEKLSKNSKKKYNKSRALIKSTKPYFVRRNYQKVAENMIDISKNTYKNDHFIFLAGLKVLVEHPEFNDNQLIEFIDNLNLLILNKREIYIEFFIQRLKMGIFKKMDCDHIRYKSKHIKDILSTYNIYKAIMDYITSKYVHNNLSSKSESIIKSFHAIFKELHEINDIFVLTFIDLLFQNNKLDEIEMLLESYIEKNRCHLNSYIYLYSFLKYHHRSEEKELNILHEILNLDPSNKLVLNLIPYYMEKYEYTKALKIIFDFLDNEANKDDIEGWASLSTLITTLNQNDKIDLLHPIWKKYKYWIQYHFNTYQLKALNEEKDIKLVSLKFSVAQFLPEKKLEIFIAATCEKLKTINKL